MTAITVARDDRAFLRVYGRDPVKMIQGLVSNDVTGAPDGQGVYAVMLSPKGKMQADLRIFRRGDELLLETDVAALENVRATLEKFMPPIFARYEDVTAQYQVIGVYGEHARDVVASVLDAPPDDAPEDAFTVNPRDEGDVLCVSTRIAGDHGFDIVAPVNAADELRNAFEQAGATRGDLEQLNVLRIENARPAWGHELDESVIPLEAGLRKRAFSETKGCYTGQEVIVRILHRGHVNRHLRGVLLGDATPPARGTELYRPDDAKLVGTITSACVSPRMGQTIAMAYVRREVEPPATLRLESDEGAEVTVVELPFAAAITSQPSTGTADA